MKEIWDQVRTAIKARIPGHSFRMWIEPMEYIRTNGDLMILSCPNFFSKKRVQEQYSRLIESELNKASGKLYKLTIEILQKGEKKELKADAPCQLELPRISTFQNSGRLMRKDFTFDHFVVGGNNSFAYSAALSLASRNAMTQNSLFLLSNTGMGKSHLSQAIGNHILSEFPSERVYYITAEDFSNEMIHAFKHGSIDAFKEKYRNQCDVLLIEDVHFLSGKERSQLELALTLDTLFDAEKKLIFTSACLPNEIPKLNDKLRSRLSCGLISNIESPDYKTRLKILKHKSKTYGYQIPEEVKQYLASELTENVRQIESGLIGVATKASLMGVKIDRSLAESVVKNIVRQQKSITLDVIKNVVCKHYNISVKDIVSKSRKQTFVRPRQIAIYLSRQYTDQPLQAIGKSFNRYHATALHAIGAVEKEIKQKSPVQKQVAYLCDKLDAGDY